MLKETTIFIKQDVVFIAALNNRIEQVREFRMYFYKRE